MTSPEGVLLVLQPLAKTSELNPETTNSNLAIFKAYSWYVHRN